MFIHNRLDDAFSVRIEYEATADLWDVEIEAKPITVADKAECFAGSRPFPALWLYLIPANMRL